MQEDNDIDDLIYVSIPSRRVGDHTVVRGAGSGTMVSIPSRRVGDVLAIPEVRCLYGFHPLKAGRRRGWAL